MPAAAAAVQWLSTVGFPLSHKYDPDTCTGSVVALVIEAIRRSILFV